MQCRCGPYGMTERQEDLMVYEMCTHCGRVYLRPGHILDYIKRVYAGEVALRRFAQ